MGAPLFIIGEAVVDEAVAQAKFCCDLEVCKGACCTLEGGRGAPLEHDEVLEIEKAYPIVKRYLDEKNIHTIETTGLFDGTPGDIATNCVENRECVFVYRENGIALCSIEKAFMNGELDWRKPISCHLFPIRIRHVASDMITYEQIDECGAGRARGNQEQTALHEFLREPLIREYGEQWYRKFLEYCRSKNNESDGTIV